MKPIATGEEMRDIDANAPVPGAVLIRRAGWAVAQAAKRMLGGTYGRRVAVIAGKGNNGADGRVAAELLSRRGALVRVQSADEVDVVDPCDLIIDAAYGTGFKGLYEAPDPGQAAVLAVDIPSGVHCDTGEAAEAAVRADRTITFAALKPGLLFGAGEERSGRVDLVDIGLDASLASAHLVEQHDVLVRLGAPQRSSHKWKTAVAVIAGSPGMMGSGVLACRGAQRSGSGMVLWGAPGLFATATAVGEAVGFELPNDDWASDALAASERVKAAVVGPGLGRDPKTVGAIRQFVASAKIPLVVDADGLNALTPDVLSVLRKRTAPTVLTPHDGEFARLTGSAPSALRMNDVRALARETNCVVLLKGSTTCVAQPNGQVLVSNTGGPRLATAGAGDVLCGIIAAFLASGLEAEWAAAAGAYIHGAAGQLGFDRGLMAGDLPDLVAKWFELSEKRS